MKKQSKENKQFNQTPVSVWVLKSMTDFVLEIEDYVHESHNKERGFELIKNYANFLKQPLKLWMFVPYDENGNLWIFPPTEDERIWSEKDSVNAELSYIQKIVDYQKAKECMLFDGFEMIDNSYLRCKTEAGLFLDLDEELMENMTVEDLVSRVRTIQFST